MKLKILVAMVILFGSSTTPAGANELSSLDQGAFGLRWGESYEEVKTAHAAVAPMPEPNDTTTIKGGFEFEGASVPVLSVRFDKTRQVTGISFGIQPEHQNEVLKRIIAALGEPRKFAMKEGAVYSHILEWSRPAASVIATLVTKSPETTDAR